LARPKTHYYGAFPEGFLWRAKALLGDTRDLCHLCSGPLVDPGSTKVDLDPGVNPTVVADATKTPFPDGRFSAVLVDPPYSSTDAEHYVFKECPDPHKLLFEALRIVRPGGRVGFLHYFAPRPPKVVRLVALVSILMGYKNRVRVYSVYEKPLNPVSEPIREVVKEV
jgi:SAM-dependent methyltransferase